MNHTGLRAILVAVILGYVGPVGADSIRALHHQAMNGQLAKIQGQPTAASIVRFGIERGACYGRCPMYSVVFYADGRVEYDGGKFVERLGRHTGTLPTEYFLEVARMIEDANYFQMQTRYAKAITDMPSVYTMAEGPSKQLKVIENYGSGGPGALGRIEWRMSELLEYVEWD